MESIEIINKYIKKYEENIICMHNPKIMSHLMEIIREMKIIKNDLELLEKIKEKKEDGKF